MIYTGIYTPVAMQYKEKYKTIITGKNCGLDYNTIIVEILIIIQ